MLDIAVCCLLVYLFTSLFTSLTRYPSRVTKQHCSNSLWWARGKRFIHFGNILWPLQMHLLVSESDRDFLFLWWLTVRNLISQWKQHFTVAIGQKYISLQRLSDYLTGQRKHKFKKKDDKFQQDFYLHFYSHSWPSIGWAKTNIAYLAMLEELALP